MMAIHRQLHAGGKGLNQSLALARAGTEVRHLGAVGAGGDSLIAVLQQSGVDVSGIAVSQEPTGHAVIQRDLAGENAIVLFSGANRTLEISQIQQAITTLPSNSWVLTQNETNAVPEILSIAKATGKRVAWNPAPFTIECRDYPLDGVDVLIVNEIEGQGFSGETDPTRMLTALAKRVPQAILVLTLGEAGSMAWVNQQIVSQPAPRVERVVDTTAAGDTFTGYLLAAISQNASLPTALERASRAAAVCIQRSGAAPSIPWARELSPGINDLDYRAARSAATTRSMSPRVL